MTETDFESPDKIRAEFSAAMSAMYREEVPAYGTLVNLVARVNSEALAIDAALRERLEATGSLARISQERHGAIRLGTPAELAMMRRAFAVMGMFPVGYYDLSVAGVPVHSTAFRPIDDESLNRNPFRVFTSLLRLDLIEDRELRAQAASVLAGRNIFTANAIELIEKAESAGGLDRLETTRFIAEILETFRWQDSAIVSSDTYRRMHDAHRLIADVVSFRGPHINHLTPRTLDIDQVQTRMPGEGIVPKAIIEGPPARACPILLRQTSFKALEEAVCFIAEDGSRKTGSHTARFGEIEQRGVALTPRGRALYDRLLEQARSMVPPAPDGSNAVEYVAALDDAFTAFPDSWDGIRTAGLGYFRYGLTAAGMDDTGHERDLETAIADGRIRFDPIVYEDFLPVSAAGIFQSNLGEAAAQDYVAGPNQLAFERDLGVPVLDEFAHYAQIEQRSIAACLKAPELAATAK